MRSLANRTDPRRTSSNLRRCLQLLLASAFLTVIVGASPVSAQTFAAALGGKAPDAAAIIAKAAADGAVRVVVTFASSASLLSAGADAGVLAGLEAQIGGEQDAILADHFGSATALSAGPGGIDRSLRRMLISPAFALNVDEAELESLAADPRIVRIDPDRVASPLLLQTLPLIGMPAAYANGGTGSGQAVAIIDTGIQDNHEFLTGGRIVAEHCFSSALGSEVSLCPNGLSEQDGPGAANVTTGGCLDGSSNICAHGTHVAGIAAGYNTSPSGGEPANGVAYASDIVAIQVFHRVPGCGPFSTPCVESYLSDTRAALEWLLVHALSLPGGVRLASVNMSLGVAGVGYSGSCNDVDPGMRAAIDNLRNAGVATAIAAGDDFALSLFNFQIEFPACISSAIAVSRSDKTDDAQAPTDISGQTALFAPGGAGGPQFTDVLSSVVSSTNQAYATMAGSSMAAPHVAGAIAAIRSACPIVPYTSAGVDWIVHALETTGKPISVTRGLIFRTTVTKPRLQVDRAIPIACDFGKPAAALDPLTLLAILGLAALGLGWRFRRA